MAQFNDINFDLLKDNVSYTACYCEENIYHLAEELKNRNISSIKTFALFISSELKQTPIWYQKASSNPNRCVYWDYHVVLIAKSCCGCPISNSDFPLKCPCNCDAVVFDFDSTLGFCTSLNEYFACSFQPQISCELPLGQQQ
jgi:hypothetical protein